MTPVDALLSAHQAVTVEGHEQIGTIELHGTPLRVLPLDVNEASGSTTPTMIAVKPGVFPLYSNGLVTYWMMPGQIVMQRLGDGLFTLNPPDVGNGPVVVVPSRFFGPNEWAEFLAADAGQRYRVTLWNPEPLP